MNHSGNFDGDQHPIHKHFRKQKRGGLNGRSGISEKKPGVLVTLTEGDRGPARAALAKPSVRFKDGDMRLHKNTAETPRGRAGGRMKPSDRDPTVHQRLINAEDVNPSRTRGDVQSRDVDQSSKGDDTPAAAKRRLQPLLGYDWIAGVLDTEDSVVERPDEFFDDLRVFRSLNKDECVHAVQTECSDVSLPVSALLTDQEDPESNKDSHQCTFSYRINSRLFPVPLHSQDCCTVCKRLKSSHPHTTAEPALIRVNIPRSALLPPHRYKAHRRCSFDPSDSFGLPAHCLSGWSNTGQSSIPPPSSLDLRSNLHMKHSPDTEMEQT
uniref:Migration and invasion inhibitory protein n=1 Tax=Oryzias melastigma TaxID=30732 RepID=A0A3B3DXM9_ORYME